LRDAPIPGTRQRDTLKRWLWFIGLWAVGAGVTALVGLIIKLWLR
jgi:hypothetical protein